MPDLDVLFVPVGGGSGVLSAAVVARAVNPKTRVIGVQAEERRQSTARGRPSAG